MKKISPNILLFITLVLSVVTIFLVEFILDDIPEIFDGGAKLGNIFVSVSLSYIAAYFFYIVTFIIPRKTERKNIEEHAAHLINMSLFYILFIMQDATNMNISQRDLKLKNLNEDDFSKAMKGVFMDHELKRNYSASSD